jgi:hypothetical protein
MEHNSRHSDVPNGVVYSSSDANPMTAKRITLIQKPKRKTKPTPPMRIPTGRAAERNQASWLMPAAVEDAR